MGACSAFSTGYIAFQCGFGEDELYLGIVENPGRRGVAHKHGIVGIACAVILQACVGYSASSLYTFPVAGSLYGHSGKSRVFFGVTSGKQHEVEQSFGNLIGLYLCLCSVAWTEIVEIRVDTCVFYSSAFGF